MPIASAAQLAGRVRLVSIEEARCLPSWRDGLAGCAKDHRYYEVLAETMASQFDFRGLVVEDTSGKVRAVMPCFVVSQDLVATAPRWGRALIGALRRVVPGLLRLRMLMLGCAAGEGHVAGSGAYVSQIAAALPALARAERASLIVWKDFPASDRRMLRVLEGGPMPENEGSTKNTKRTKRDSLLSYLSCFSWTSSRLPSMPATRLALEFTSFDDYLTRRLSHAMRKSLRRKLKALASAPPITMQVRTSVAEIVDEVHGLYLQVYERSPLKFEKLTKPFLIELGSRMPERVRFFTWEQDGRLIAFSLCFVHAGVLYDEYLGLDYRIALDLHLYFVTFRDVLSWAIAQGLSEYRSTPLNYDPKLHLGLDLAPLDLYVAPAHPWMSPLLRAVLPWISPARSEPILQKFRNADEL